MNENGAITPIAIEFVSDGKTIRWGNGCIIKLGINPWMFLKTLYFADGQQMTVTEVEEKVWGEGADGTIQTTATNLRKILAENNFPYTIVNIINREWEESENPSANDSSAIPTLSAIMRFALVLA